MTAEQTNPLWKDDGAQATWEKIKSMTPDQIKADLERYGHVAEWR